MAKNYSVSEIKDKLRTNDKWLIRGLLALYAKQTADERSSGVTKHENGMGFNGTDATFLSSLARQVQVWQATENPRYDRPLSDRQFASLRRAMLKYAGQLARIAEQNNPVEDEDTELGLNRDPHKARLQEEATDRRAAFEAKKAREIEATDRRAADQAARDANEAALEAAAERAAIQDEYDDAPVDADEYAFAWD